MEGGYLSWEDARPIVQDYFCFWPDGEDRIWAKACWAALDKSGLTAYHTEKEEMVCRSHVGLLALFYQEFIERFGIDTHCRIRDKYLTELFMSPYGEIEEWLNKLRKALHDKLGLGELFRMTLLSIEAGQQSARIPIDLLDEVNAAVEDPLPLFIYKGAFSLTDQAVLDPRGFVGCWTFLREG